MVITMADEHLNRHEKAVAIKGQPVTTEDVNSKRYFIRANSKPTDDMGEIGDICFVFDVV